LLPTLACYIIAASFQFYHLPAYAMCEKWRNNSGHIFAINMAAIQTAWAQKKAAQYCSGLLLHWSASQLSKSAKHANYII